MGDPVIEIFNDLGFNLRGKTSGEVKTTCVHCSHTRKKQSDPCCSVSIESGMYNCHNCGKSGNIHKFKRAERLQPKIYYRPEWKNKTELDDKAVKYFESRKISQSTIKELHVAMAFEWMPQTQKEERCICFNYFCNGELINTKFRTAQKHFKLVKDAELILYNFDALSNKELIITEGEFDALSFYECGLKNVVSVPNGASAKQMEWLDNCIDQFSTIEKIYLATDSDSPGLKLRDELARRIGQDKCFKVDFRDCKDANEYLVKYGKPALILTIEDAEEMPIEGIFTVMNFEQELDALYHEGLQPGLKIQSEQLDNFITWETKRLAIVTGIPGHGKSEFIDEVCERLNFLHQWKTGYFSPENFPLQIHASKIIEKIIGKRFNETSMQADEYNMGKVHLYKNFYFIKPSDEHFNLDAILDRGKVLIKKYGIKCLVIDPWNRLEHQLEKGETDTNYTGRMLDKMINFAHTYDVLIILMAHPRKMMKKKDGGQYEIPNLYDISGSANFFNKCDYGITVYRDFIEEKIDIHVQKVKFKHLGGQGVVSFRYNINNGRFAEFEGLETHWDNTNHLTKETFIPNNNNIQIYREF